jgi:uncharacterized protein
MLIRMLIWIIAAVVIYRSLKGWMGAGKAQRNPLASREANQVDDEMIKDPVCGTYFPKREAVIAHSHNRVLQFCSSQCRDRYFNEQGDSA